MKIEWGMQHLQHCIVLKFCHAILFLQFPLQKKDFAEHVKWLEQDKGSFSYRCKTRKLLPLCEAITFNT
jgi:hypothetical protein